MHPHEADDAALWRSMVQEREMLLEHRRQLREALGQIGAFAQISTARPRKNEALLHIATIAEEALKL